jgi:hypothetical protein
VRPLALAVLGTVTLVACGSTSGPPTDNPGTGGAGGGGAGGSANTGGSAGVTYYQDVAPILQGKCVTCHVSGGIAPFALDTPVAAVQQAAAMKLVTGSREMPPWPPGPLSPKLLHDRSLSDAQIGLLAAWADGGAPLGDAAHPAPPGQPDVIDIGTADFSVDMGVDYVPDTSLTDDYHCFLVDLQRHDDRMITGYRITPGNGRIVHHVITSLFAASDRAALEALDAETPDRAGWPCVGGPVPTDSAAKADGSLGAWVPGVSSVLMPAGTGTALHAGDLAVMQVHYNLLAGHDPDRTKIEVKLAPAGSEASLQQLATLRLVRRQLDLPANQAGIVEETTLAANLWTLGKFYPDGEASLLAVAGHMHLLGTHITLERTNASGSATLLDIPAWDFHWQGSYQLATPIAIRADDQLTIRCVYDNTAERRAKEGYIGPIADVHWGEGTEDEMCIGYLTVADQAPAAP